MILRFSVGNVEIREYRFIFGIQFTTNGFKMKFFIIWGLGSIVFFYKDYLYLTIKDNVVRSLKT
jgi:hypothetical protein